jgi:hypothetical protein
VLTGKSKLTPPTTVKILNKLDNKSDFMYNSCIETDKSSSE